MSKYDEELSQLFLALVDTFKLRVKDPETPAGVLKEAREFLKDNSVTKDSLDVKTFEGLKSMMPLENFEENYGNTAH